MDRPIFASNNKEPSYPSPMRDSRATARAPRAKQSSNPSCTLRRATIYGCSNADRLGLSIIPLCSAALGVETSTRIVFFEKDQVGEVLYGNSPYMEPKNSGA